MAKRKKIQLIQQNQQQREIIIGITWYTLERFIQMKSVADDADSLDDTYTDWLKNASNHLQSLEKDGYEVVKVPIDIEEWVIWCKENGYDELNGAARSSFVSYKVANIELH
jgi:hypothetical protein